jgi:signal transduction histidine kinase
MLFVSAERYFRELGPRGRTVLFQLPLSVTMLLVTVLVTFLHPELEWSGPFAYSLAVHLFLLGACAFVPWEKLPGRAVFIIPVLDCLALGVSREAADQYLAVLGFLLVFPVTWLSTTKHRRGVIIAILATLLSAVLPPIILGTGITKADFVRIVLLPVILAAIALTVYAVYNTLSLRRRLLEEQQTEVQELLRAREEREQLLGTVMDTVSVGVCALDAQGRTILTNRHLSRHLTGVGIEDPFGPWQTNVPVYDVDGISPLPPDQHPFSRAARGETFTDELIWSGSGTVQRAYSATSRLLKRPNGQRCGAVLAFTDVTALVEALTVKDQFVASVSHELRTPLTSILGYLELAFDEDLEPGLEDYLSVVHRNAQRLLSLVDDLLTIASDALTINPRPADLAEVLDHSVEAARPRATAAGITLELEKGGPVRGIFDPDRLGQAIGNVVSNAIKYTPKGGTIKVRAGTSVDRLSCEVTDTGIGMNAQELNQAFTRFFRAANAHSSTIPGAGLGLAITKTIIENHKGTVTLFSSPGKGTTVVLTLPQAATDSSP